MTGPLFSTDATTQAVGARLAGSFDPLGLGLAPTRVRNKTTPSRVVTLFQSGHGFTSGNADATSAVNDTASADAGFAQCATLVTKGDSTISTLGNGATSTVDLTGCNVRIRLRGNNLRHIRLMEVYAGTGGLTNRYAWQQSGGSISTLYRAEVDYAVNYSKDSEWVDLDLTFADATTSGTPTRSTINAWQLRIADDGLAKVTVNWQGISTVPKSAAYPSGVVSWTWDDAMLSPVQYAKPRLDLYGYLSTYYVILDVMGSNQTGGPYFTPAQCKALYLQGNDIAPHCTTLARHSSTNGMVDLSPADLLSELQTLKTWFRANGYTRSADHFATPQGKFTPAMIDTMRQFFASHRTTIYNTMETLRPGNPMRLRSIPLPASGGAVSVAQCTAAIDRAYAEGSWVIFMGHKIVTGTSTGSLECTQTDFNTICDYVATKGIPVRTVSEVLDTI